MILCPSERFYEQRGHHHQSLTERAWQMRRLLVRWLPGREMICGADSSIAVLALLDNVKGLPRVSIVTQPSDPPPPVLRKLHASLGSKASAG